MKHGNRIQTTEKPLSDKSEQKLGSMLNIFTWIAIFISCLGLLSLAAFISEQRTKEIGIRKVLGASVSNIIFTLSKDFIKCIIAANIIAIPVGYYIMNKWLQNFAYRTEMDWWIFASAAVLALLTALITVSFQTVKAAMANPVDSLRNE